MTRKKFLKFLAAAGTVFSGRSLYGSGTPGKKQFVGVLTDTTRCIGCRSCEIACAKTHGLPVPDVENDKALLKERTTTEKRRTVVNSYETDKGTVFVKRQCMHCWQPACASACLTNAMYKTEDGPIIWRSGKCMGCRYCMVSCPFSMPKAEYNTWNPKIEKCDLCWDRLKEGKKPACVEACPTDTLMFGLKRNLMEVARTRIYNHPKKYVHHIYGEHEVGGAGWLYLSSVPFEKLGFRTDLGTNPYPEYTKEFLYAVPAVLLIIPTLLYGINQLTKDEDKAEDDHE